MGASDALTPKQDEFCRQYLVDLNATQAAIRAGYAPRSASVTGARLLANAKVAAAISGLKSERAERTGVEADRVLEELALLSHSDIRHYVVSDAGHLALAAGAPDAAMRAVRSVKRRVKTRRIGELVEKTVEVEFTLWDKPASVRMAASHLGLLKTVHEIHARTLEEVLKEALPDGAGDSAGQ